MSENSVVEVLYFETFKCFLSFRFVNYMLFSLYQASKKPEKPKSEAQQIQSEVERLCRKCGVQYTKVAENKYRVSWPIFYLF